MCVHFQHSGLRSSCTEWRVVGQVLLPPVLSPLLLLPGPRGKGGRTLLVPNPSVPCFSAWISLSRGPISWGLAARCPGVLAPVGHFQTLPAHRQHPQQRAATRHSALQIWAPKPSLDPGRSSGSRTPSPGKPLLSDSVPPQGLHHLCSCFRLYAESLKTGTPFWTPEGMEPPQHLEPHLHHTEGALTAFFLRVLIQYYLSCFVV